MRASGYKCYQTKCGACEGNVCREPFDMALRCDAKLVKPQTNADRIRAMSDEELAEVVLCTKQFDPNAPCYGKTCYECALGWLRQPVKDGDDDG